MEARIREWLGDDARSFRYTIGGRERDGWKAPAKGRDEAWAAKATEALRHDDVRVYVGDGGRVVYALPALSPVDVIEHARVGSHNDGADPRDVRAVLEQVAIPFDVTFADEAGLAAVFRDPIDRARAHALAKEVLDRGWIDSIGFMAEEGEEGADELGDDEDGLGMVVAYVVGHNAVRLWWD
jgi:hypothetical protein